MKNWRSELSLFIGKNKTAAIAEQYIKGPRDLRRRDRQSEHSNLCALGVGDGEAAGRLRRTSRR